MVQTAYVRRIFFIRLVCRFTPPSPPKYEHIFPNHIYRSERASTTVRRHTRLYETIEVGGDRSLFDKKIARQRNIHSVLGDRVVFVQSRMQ